MKSDFQIITTPTCDTPGSLLLFTFHGKKYLFGQLGEGAQRAMIERNVRMVRIKEYFLTGNVNSMTTGGLMGVVLTVADVLASRKQALAEERRLAQERWVAQQKIPTKKNQKSSDTKPPKPEPFSFPAEDLTVTFHGGKNILNIVGATRDYVFRHETPLKVEEYKAVADPTQPYFEDENIKVYALEATSASSSLGKRSFDEITENDATTANDMKRMHKNNVLQKVVQQMFNLKKDALLVVEGDEDYAEALATRMREDAERDARAAPTVQHESGKNIDNQQDLEVEESGNLPNKRLKTSVDGAFSSSFAYNNGLEGDTAVKTQVSFSGSRPLRRPWPATTLQRLPATSPSKASTSLIVVPQPMRGRFLAEKAKELGVKAGPDFGKLIAGQSITTDSGNVVTREQCLEPDIQLPVTVILDIPDQSYVDSSLEILSQWRSKHNFNIGAYYWILGAELEKSDKIESFIKNNTSNHIIFSPSLCTNGIVFDGSASQITRLNVLNDENFPLPYYDKEALSTSTSLPYHLAQPFLTYALAPKAGIDETRSAYLFDANSVRENLKILGEGKYLELAKETRAAIEIEEREGNGNKEFDFPGSDVEIITLGTGSALPSKYRNGKYNSILSSSSFSKLCQQIFNEYLVSGTLVRIPNVGNLLLDCGENTLGQMYRSLGDIQDVLVDLKCLYISHLHADHHLGTASLLKRWSQAMSANPENSSKLYLVAPGKFFKWLDEYSEIDDMGINRVVYVPSELLLEDMHSTNVEMTEYDRTRVQDLYKECSLKRVQTSFAVHAKHSFTVAFEFSNPEGFKMAYSGDTRPTKGFVRIGKNSTILIHEATFDDELIKEAKAKRHCTTSEAIKAGREMGAKNLLLTHFSQRYPKLPMIESAKKPNNEEAELTDPILEQQLNVHKDTANDSMQVDIDDGTSNVVHGINTSLDESSDSTMNIAFAFDLLRLKMSQMKRLQKFIPALQELFKEQEKVDDAENDGSEVSGPSMASADSPLSKKQQKKQARKDVKKAVRSGAQKSQKPKKEGV